MGFFVCFINRCPELLQQFFHFDGQHFAIQDYQRELGSGGLVRGSLFVTFSVMSQRYFFNKSYLRSVCLLSNAI